MIANNVRIAGLFFAASLIAGFSSPSSAADYSDAEVKAGINRTLNSVNRLFLNGGTAKQVADALYDKDLMVVGEGEKQLYKGLDFFMKRLEYYVKDANRCTLTALDPIRHSGDIAASFVLEHCASAQTGGSDEDARILYVFRKGDKGWRATMELFGWGVF